MNRGFLQGLGMSIKSWGFALRWGRQAESGLKSSTLDIQSLRSQSDIQVEAAVDCVHWYSGDEQGGDPDEGVMGV